MDMVQSSGTVDAAVTRLYDVRMQKAPLEDEEDTLKNMIKSHMGNAGKLISQEGEELASFKSPVPKVKTDYKGIVDGWLEHIGDHNTPLHQAFNKLIADNTKAYTQSRRFLLKAKYE